MVYTLGALVASAVSTRLYLWSFAVPFGAMRAFVMEYALAWPLIPTLVVMLTLSLRTAILLALGYYLAGAAVVLLWSLVSSAVLGRPDVSPLGNLLNYSGFLAIEVVPPLAVIVATGGRKLRPVTPLVLAGLLAFSFAALVLAGGIRLPARLGAPARVAARLPPRRCRLVHARRPAGGLRLLARAPRACARLRGEGLQRHAASGRQLVADRSLQHHRFAAGRLQWRGLLDCWPSSRIERW